MSPPALQSKLAADLKTQHHPVLGGQNGLAVQSKEELASAFDLFNDVSLMLADTYREMEERVGSLNAELHQVAEQRLDELKEKERVSNRLENLLNLLPAGVVVLDSKGVVNQCNPAAREFLGEPLVGQLWRDIILRCFAPQVDDGHEISLKDGRRISMDTRSLQGEPGQLILLTDLTETRRLQQHLHRHRRLSEMGRMMSSLAHQIRTPLSAAMLYAGHLCESDLTHEQSQRFSTKILSRLQHLDQQVKDMLIFVKGDVKLTDRLSLGEVMSALEKAMEVSLANSASRCTIDNEVPDALLECNLDSMVGALMNLVNNALEADSQGVDITIRCCQSTDQQLHISVADNGPGICPDIQKNLQEPFFTTKSQGTGLGLSVVRAVAQAHHGSFELVSVRGQGTCARIRLPLCHGVSPDSHFSENRLSDHNNVITASSDN